MDSRTFVAKFAFHNSDGMTPRQFFARGPSRELSSDLIQSKFGLYDAEEYDRLPCISCLDHRCSHFLVDNYCGLYSAWLQAQHYTLGAIQSRNRQNSCQIFKRIVLGSCFSNISVVIRKSCNASKGIKRDCWETWQWSESIKFDTGLRALCVTQVDHRSHETWELPG